MLTEIAQIGKIVEKNGTLLQHLEPDDVMYKTIVIFFKQEDKNIIYDRTEEEPYDPVKHYFMVRSPNGPGITPGTTLGNKGSDDNEKVENVKSVFKKKIVKWFEENSSLIPVEIVSVDSLVSEMKNKENQIAFDVKKKLDSVIVNKKRDHKRGKILVVPAIEENGNITYLTDKSKFQNAFNSMLSDTFSKSSGTGTCYLCGKNDVRVDGNVPSTIGLKFATTDKPGFAPSLFESEFWKTDPICSECSNNLKVGNSFIRANLDHTYPGNNNKIEASIVRPGVKFNLLIIPSSADESQLQRFLAGAFKYEKEGINGIVMVEDSLKKLIEEPSGAANPFFKMTFLFYENAQARVRVLKYIEGVIPSVLLRIRDAQEDVGESDFKYYFSSIPRDLDNLKNKFFGHGDYHYPWFVSFLLTFYYQGHKGNSNKSVIIDNEFFRILGSVLSGTPVQADIFHKAIPIIRSDLWNDFIMFEADVIRALFVLDFLRKLPISSSMEVETNMEKTNENFPPELMELFDRMNVTDSSRRAAVATGILVSRVLSVQREERGVERGKEPFLSKLNNLRVDRRHLRNIATEAIAKLNQYGKSWGGVAEASFKYLLESDDISAIHPDELSFYFAAGIVLGDVMSLSENGPVKGGDS